MNISSYEEKKALPVGIVMEVTDSSYWNGQRWIKTGDSRWAQIGGLRSEEIVPDEKLAEMVAAGAMNISPCPADTLGFPAAYADWNINILVGGAVKNGQALEACRRRERVLAQRNGDAVRALQGIAEEA